MERDNAGTKVFFMDPRVCATVEQGEREREGDALVDEESEA